ncbi:serine/threonine protein kinase [Nannizzia gypsea CBS 118893]|uniref:EKC/KEOPS complex subunit BUD32 n=1 Tax=Arthroderma gypseum (strain ATCC MYA-4604 / CBS 118893) TaxID=535722 RepID=E4V492_ARTGP|nr:serine/threonine protein kinase [Nannizzia gypsea CBS 118893]EFR04816.1 serine/threonine protein kinase [Nannizzia gypsea CBS 118893]
MCFFGNDDDDMPPARYIDPPEGSRFITAGGSGLIYSSPTCRGEIYKICSHDSDSIVNIEREKLIFENMMSVGQHPNIVKCLKIMDNGVILERAEHGDLRDYYQNGGGATISERVKWCKELASAVEYIHSLHIRHGDLCGKNVLLDADRNIKLCDFAGSGFCGNLPTVSAELGYAHPNRDQNRRATVIAEIHALGSTMYEILTTKRPFSANHQPGVVAWWLNTGIYPRVDHIPLGKIIEACWKGKYPCALQVEHAIELAIVEAGMNNMLI